MLQEHDTASAGAAPLWIHTAWPIVAMAIRMPKKGMARAASCSSGCFPRVQEVSAITATFCGVSEGTSLYNGLEVDVLTAAVDDEAARAELLLLSPSHLVPRLEHGGTIAWGIWAIAEHLHELDLPSVTYPVERERRSHCRSVCGEMLSGFGDGDGFAEGVALADDERQFGFVVERSGRCESGWRGFGCGAGLAPGAVNVCAARDDRRGAAVITDGDVFVVGEERIVRAKDFADAASVVEAGVEVGVVADGKRQTEFYFINRMEKPVDTCLYFAGSTLSEDVGEPVPECLPTVRTKRQ